MKYFKHTVTPEGRSGFTIILDSNPAPQEGDELSEPIYRDTALPFAGSSYRPAKEAVPEEIRQMRRLVRYNGVSLELLRAENFCRQAVFMQDYEDDLPWEGDFVHYFPTYQDMTVRQLRGYFTWRTQVRRGDYQPIPVSAAYLYLYELLNGIGAASPEECLQKMADFEAGYVDAGMGDRAMRTNLRRWMLEYAVLRGLPSGIARQAADRELIERDDSLLALQHPAEHSDEEVFSALCLFGGKKTAESPVLAADPERGRHLFSEVWRAVSSSHFSLCFGERVIRSWYPLYNAVFLRPAYEPDRDYALDACRSYHCRHGVWHVNAYEKLSFNRGLLQGFLHETDARLRRYLNTHRYLRESPADAWAVPYIDKVINADRQAILEASRPKITIDLAGLEQIRKDAGITRDSLLTAEELEEPGETSQCPGQCFPPAGEYEDEPSVQQAADFRLSPAPFESDLPLDTLQAHILELLLHDDSASLTKLMKENHLMPSIMADTINEALYDELGDTALLCEDDRLSIVEDYREDLARLIGLPGDAT